MRPTLYVSDMDGTLLDENARLSATTRTGVLRLLDAGVPFTVATARSPRSIGHILDGIPLALPVVSLHGAILSDLTTGRHVRIRELSTDAAATMLRIARGHATSIWVSTHDGERDHVSRDVSTNAGSEWYDDELAENRDPRRRHVPDVSTVLEEQVVCITVIDTEARIRRIAAEMEEALGGAATVHAFENAYSPGWWWINAHTSDAGKDAGVRDLVAHAGLDDHEIVGFGDTGSDLNLFEASHRRIAVANADESVRAAACETIGHHTDDSVIRWILRDVSLGDSGLESYVHGRRVVEVTDGGPTLVADVYDAATPRGAVLCIHGFASGRRSAKVEELARRLPSLGWTVLALDLQGHGDSGGDFEGLTIGRSIDDVCRVAAMPLFADAPRRLLVGSSFGGLVGAWTAAESPDAFHGLLLIAPAFGYLDRYLPDLAEEERAAWMAGQPHVIEMERRTVRLGPGVLHEREARAVSRLAPALRTRTLVVHGTADESVPAYASEGFVALSRPGVVELALLDGADHRLAGRLGDLGTLAERFVAAIGRAPGPAPY